jgi:hypothetical protein
MFAILFLAGCDADDAATPPESASEPTVTSSQTVFQPCRSTYANVPVIARQQNYGSGGSCAWAAAETALRYHGYDDLADCLRRQYSGGATVVGQVSAAFDSRGLDYAYTVAGDAAFLDWCARTRRVAMLQWVSHGAWHSINFCGYSGGKAILIDNNAPAKLLDMPREQFIQTWKSYRGVALVLVEPPAPPDPITTSITE